MSGAPSVPQNPWADPGASGERLEVSDFMTFHLLGLSALSRNCVTRVYLAPHGVTLPEWRLLATAVKFSPVPVSEIIAMTSMDKGQVSRTLKATQRKGLVHVQVARGSGQKSVKKAGVSRLLVLVTPAGRAMFQKILPEAQRCQYSLIRLLTQEERYVFLKACEKLRNHLLADERSRR